MERVFPALVGICTIPDAPANRPALPTRSCDGHNSFGNSVRFIALLQLSADRPVNSGSVRHAEAATLSRMIARIRSAANSSRDDPASYALLLRVASAGSRASSGE